MEVWELGDLGVEEGGSFKVWGEWGDGLLSWVWEFMGVDYGEVFVWVGRILAKIHSLFLGWGIE